MAELDGAHCLTSTPQPTDASAVRMPWLLGLGAALGLALAATGLLESPGGRAAGAERGGRGAEERPEPGSPRDPEVAAIVGTRVIRRVDFERMLAGVARDLRSPIDAGTRERVLDRMIDEELLVQRGIALGLAGSDRRVRGELVSSLVDSIVAEVAGEVPSRTEVEGHFAEHADFFTPPAKLRVEALFFANAPTGETASERASRALALLRDGAGVEQVASERADRELAPVPEALLPIAKLRDYLGPEVVAALMALEPERWSEPIEVSGGARIVRVLEREPGEVPALDSIVELVERDLVRRRADEALRRYLDQLRDEIAVERNVSLFEPGADVDAPAPAPTSASALRGQERLQ